MLCVETIGKIRRRRLIHQDSISEIARDLGLSRNTVKKALRSGGEPFDYRRQRQPRPRLGPYLGVLDQWLDAEQKLPVRERRTAQRLYAHARAFVHLGGIPRRGIYDNMKTAVDAIFVGKERRYNRRFLAMCSHYLIEPTACTPASGWEKRQVENQVGTARGWAFTPKPRFADLAALNAWLAERCTQIARERRHPEHPERTIGEVWEEERAALQPMPPAFDGFHERACRVSSTALVYFERNRYSVECRYAGRTVSLRAYAQRIVIVLEGLVIGEHERRFSRYNTVYNPWHYVPALEHKPGALRNGAPFKDWHLPASMTRLRERLARHGDGDRQFVEILSMVALYGLDAVAARAPRRLRKRSSPVHMW